MTNQPPRFTPWSGTTWPWALTIDRPWACSMLIWADDVLEYSPVNIRRLDRSKVDRRMTGSSLVRIISRKVLDLSRLADPTKAPGNVCMHQHATPIGDNGLVVSRANWSPS